MKKAVIIIASILIIFFLAIGISYKLVNKGKKLENNSDDNSASVVTSSNVEITETVKNEAKDKEEKFSEINKDSSVAREILEFLPKSYQTYPWKLNEDYMLYEAIYRLSKDESIKTNQVEGINTYKYDDVDKMIKTIYGDSAKITKKESYTSPVEYFEASNSFGIYPVGIDSTDNMMVIKSVKENDDIYVVTVYSVCVYMDMESDNTDNLYIITKDTMKKYYSLISRNDSSIKDTYKQYKLESTELNPQDIVDKFEEDLPKIEFYLTKTNDSENKYYVSDIKDIY